MHTKTAATSGEARDAVRCPLGLLLVGCALLLNVGCAILSSDERAAWERGKEYQASGRHEDAIVEFSRVVNAHTPEEQDDPEVLPLRLDLAQSYYALDRFAEAQDTLDPLSANPELTVDQRSVVLQITGWVPLRRAREQDLSPNVKREFLTTSRRYFNELLAQTPESYEGRLGRGLALYETSKLLNTKTHLAHALELFKKCSAQRPRDAVLLFAQARAMQRFLGEGTPEALSLLRRAFNEDRSLKEKVTYGELFAVLAAYPNAAILEERVPNAEKRAYLQTYRELLTEASRRPSGQGAFWDKVKAYLENYEKLGEHHARFDRGVKRAHKLLLEPDLSPLAAAQEALRLLEETEAQAGDQLPLFSGPPHKKARSEIVTSLLTALKRKIDVSITTENITTAEDLLSHGFQRIGGDDSPASVDAVTWARTFQELREKLTCRRDFMQGRDGLRRQLLDSDAEEIRRELGTLKEKYRLCTEERDFKELKEELFATQSVAFQRALTSAEAAAKRKDAEEERRFLSQALGLTSSREFAHRREEILLRLARSYLADGLWSQARLHLKEIPDTERTPEAWLLLGTAFARENDQDAAYRIFSRRDLSDELDTDIRWAAAAGLTFAAKGQTAKALPLLDAALSAVNVTIPFPREKLLNELRSSLTRLMAQNEAISQREITLAENLIKAGRGDPKLTEAVGNYFLHAHRWTEAAHYLKKARAWGASVPDDVLSRLDAHLTDYVPLATGASWEYRQADSQRLVVTVGRYEGNNRYAIRLQAGDATDSLAWEKRPDGRVLCRYFGGDLSRCHVVPVGITDPRAGEPLPSREYEINGRRWTARLTSIGETVTLGDTTYEKCLLVEVSPPGSTQAVRHYFAPGVGEIKVDYPGEQRSLSRTLVTYKPGGTKDAAERDVR